MKTLLICNQKGGVGKTLLADQIMYLLEQDGIPYSFIDLDQQEGSLHKEIQRDDAVVRVIDTPGALNENMDKWMAAADMIIVPTRASKSDQPVFVRMIDMLQKYKGKKPILIVLNCLDRYTTSQNFVKWFKANYPDWKSLPLVRSEIFGTSAAEEKGVCSIKANSEPARQMTAIFGVVKYELQLCKEN